MQRTLGTAFTVPNLSVSRQLNKAKKNSAVASARQASAKKKSTQRIYHHLGEHRPRVSKHHHDRCLQLAALPVPSVITNALAPLDALALLCALSNDAASVVSEPPLSVASVEDVRSEALCPASVLDDLAADDPADVGGGLGAQDVDVALGDAAGGEGARPLEGDVGVAEGDVVGGGGDGDVVGRQEDGGHGFCGRGAVGVVEAGVGGAEGGLVEGCAGRAAGARREGAAGEEGRGRGEEGWVGGRHYFWVDSVGSEGGAGQ